MNLEATVRLLSKLPIRHRRTGRIAPFRLNWNQQRMVNQFQDRIDNRHKLPLWCVVCKARRVGVSSLADGLLFGHCLAYPNAHAHILAHLFKSTKHLFRVPTDLYRALPMNMPKPGVSKLDFPHHDGSSVLDIGTAGTTVGGRGSTFTGLHISEAAFLPVGGDSITSLLSTVVRVPWSIVVVESTANSKVGMGEAFYNLWNDAVSGVSDMLPVFLSFLDDPICRRDASYVTDAPIDEDEKDIIAARCCSIRCMQCIQCHRVLQSLSWRRWAIPNLCQGYVEKFNQEYPWCLTGDALVSTEQGIVRIKDAQDCLATESGPIESWIERPASPIFKVTTKAGRVIRGTADHPLMTSGGWKPMSGLTPGDILVLRPPMFKSGGYYTAKSQDPPCVTHSICVDESLGRWIGYFVGDGCWYRTKGGGNEVSIACDAQDQDVVSDVLALQVAKFGYGRTKDVARVQGRRGCTYIVASVGDSAFRAAKILELVEIRGADRYRKRLAVPDCILRSPRSVVKEFLRGLFEADGSSSKSGQVRFHSKLVSLVRDVQLLLLGFGITSSIVPANKKIDGSGKEYTGHDLLLNMIESAAFHECIGFVGQRKSSKKPAVGAQGRPRTPIVFEDEVESVEPDGIEITYDFRISGTHEFSSNGILSHNCAEVAFLSSGNPAFTREEMRYSRSCVTPPVAEGELYIDDPDLDSRIVAASSDPMQKRYLFLPRNPKVKFRKVAGGPVKVWEWPTYQKVEGSSHTEQKDQFYLGVDSARGSSRGDFSACVGWNSRTGGLACRIAERRGPVEMAKLIWMLGHFYNKAMLSIELTGNLGLWLQVELRDRWIYPNFYRWKGRDDRQGASRAPVIASIGWETTIRTRDLLLSTFRAGLQSLSVKPFDATLVKEMDATELEVTTGRWRWSVDDSIHDDILMAAMIGWIARMQWHEGSMPSPREQPNVFSPYPDPDAFAAKIAQPDVKGMIIAHYKKVRRHIDKGPARDRLTGI